MSLTQEVDLTIPAKDRLPEHGVWNQLNPDEWSLEEREFLLAHLGEIPAVALKGWDKSIPHNPAEDHNGARGLSGIRETPGCDSGEGPLGGDPPFALHEGCSRPAAFPGGRFRQRQKPPVHLLDLPRGDWACGT